MRMTEAEARTLRAETALRRLADAVRRAHVDGEGLAPGCAVCAALREADAVLAGHGPTTVATFIAEENDLRGTMLTLQEVADALSELLERDIPARLRPGASVGAMIIRRLTPGTPIAAEPVLRV